MVKEYTDKLSAVRQRHSADWDRSAAAMRIAVWWRRRRAAAALQEVHAAHAGIHAHRQAGHDALVGRLEEHEVALASAAEHSLAWQAELEEVQATAGELLHELERENAELAAALEAAEVRVAATTDATALREERTGPASAQAAAEVLQKSVAAAIAGQVATGAAALAAGLEHAAEVTRLQTATAAATSV